MTEEEGYQKALQRIEEYKKNPSYNRHLELSGLKLKLIPKEVIELEDLKSLSLFRNQLSDIKLLEGSTSLTSLFLFNNQLSDIKPLEGLTSLTLLHLSENQLSDIKPLEGLTSLTALYLYGNQIEDLYTTPKSVLESRLKWLKQFPKLKLQIEDNPFIKENKKIKQELYSSGGGANHYDVFISDLRQAISEEKNGGDEKDQLVLPKKMLLLGNSDAGKSTFCDYLLNNKKFADDNKASTEVLSIQKWEYTKNKNDYTFIYDFGGQDFYHGTYQMFLSNESLYVVLWDKNTDYNHKVYKETEQRKNPYINYDLRYWVSNIEYLTKELPEVRNLRLEEKSLTEEEQNLELDKTEDGLYQGNPLETVVLVENKIDIPYKERAKKILSPIINCKEQFRISLVKKAKGVAAINERRALLVNYLKDELNEMHSTESFTTIPRNIIEAFLNKREELIKEKDIILIKDFANSIFGESHPRWWNDIKDQGIKRQMAELRLALQLLHNRGLLLYYHDVPQLENSIFIDPEQVLKDIKEGIIKKASVKVKGDEVTNGKLSENDLKGFKKSLLAIAINQQIVFDNSLSNVPEEYYIIPAFLEASDKSNLLYEFSTSGMKPLFSLKFNHFMPYGFMNRIICGFGQEPHRKYFFKNEIIFTIGESENVWIKCDPVKLKINVWSTLSESENEKTKEYTNLIYRILMAAYYRIPTLDYKTFKFMHKLEEKKGELVLASIFDRIVEGVPFNRPEDKIEAFRMSSEWNKLQDFERAFYLNKEVYAPKDLMLSVDGDYYVGLQELEKAFEKHSTKTILTGESINEAGPKKTKEIKRHLFNAFMPNNIPVPKKVFISYAHDDTAFRNELQKYLINLQRTDVIEIWQDGLIEPGEDWNAKILSKLEQADWIIMLVSQSFIASNFIYEKELRIALEKVRKDGARIIPILLSNCDWKNWKALPMDVTDEIDKNPDDFSKNISDFSFLPFDENQKLKAIKKWPDQEDAWTQITDELRKLLKK